MSLQSAGDALDMMAATIRGVAALKASTRQTGRVAGPIAGARHQQTRERAGGALAIPIAALERAIE